jgi:CheY-like chemotaxis protein
MGIAPIIIIDDDKDDCELIMYAFTALKVKNEIIVFTNAVKAFEYIVNITVQPFFILCDINMPLLNGLELREKINENEKTRFMEIPFLLWSTSGRQGLNNIAYSLNIQGFFKKPDTLEKLIEIIAAITNYWEHSDRLLT